jgi:hypothetical protein
MVPRNRTASGPVRCEELNSAWSHGSAPARARHQSRNRATGRRSGLPSPGRSLNARQAEPSEDMLGRVALPPDIGIGASWPRPEPYRLPGRIFTADDGLCARDRECYPGQMWAPAVSFQQRATRSSIQTRDAALQPWSCSTWDSSSWHAALCMRRPAEHYSGGS